MNGLGFFRGRSVRNTEGPKGREQKVSPSPNRAPALAEPMASYGGGQSPSARNITSPVNGTSHGKGGDDVDMHLLVETALGDSGRYTTLDMNEVDKVKRDLATLTSQVEATRHRLKLEEKVRDTTMSMRHFGRAKAKDSAQTGSKGRVTDVGSKYDDEADQAVKKCDDLRRELTALERREFDLSTRLLQHTAGVLQQSHKGHSVAGGPADSSQITANRDALAEFEDLSFYQPYDRIMEVHGATATHAEFAQQTQIILEVERRVEDLNARLRDMILEFKPRKDHLPQPPRELHDDPDNAGDVLVGQIDFMDQCLLVVSQLQKTRGTKRDSSELMNDSELVLDVEKKVEALNAQVREMILDLRPAKEDLPDPAREIQDAPDDPEGVLMEQIEFLGNCLDSLHRLSERERASTAPDLATEEKLSALNKQLFDLMVQSNPEKASKFTPPPQASGETMLDQLDYLEGGLGAVDRRLQQLGVESVKPINYEKGADQYTSTIMGLWDIITSDDVADEEHEPFSLAAFSARVQEMHARFADFSTQKSILTRQIQQQRELNVTSDKDKDSQIAAMTSEIDKLKKDAEAARKASVTDVTDPAHPNLAAEVARLQTELTIAKAELDSAHGTRAERERQASSGSADRSSNAAHAAEKAGLQARIQTLQTELSETITDYEAMTKASIDFEKEREGLEATADTLRDRVEALETALAEERIQTVGPRSPNGSVISGYGSISGGAGGGAGTSAAVLKSEFRKMMRETRTEHAKALKSEQEERRRLESVVRSLKRELTPARQAAK